MSRAKVVMLSGLLVASCATSTPGMRALPPVDLLQDCNEPAYRSSTNGQLAEAVAALRDALRACNRDKQDLREWAR